MIIIRCCKDHLVQYDELALSIRIIIMNNIFYYLTEFPLLFCYFQLPFARTVGQLFRRKWWSVPEPQNRDRSRRIY